MGLKRLLDDEQAQEPLLKHSRHLDYGKEFTQFSEVIPYHNVPNKADFTGEYMGDFCWPECEEASEDSTSDKDAGHIEKDFETSAPFSWVSTSSYGVDSRSSSTTQSSLSHEYFESDFPHETFMSVDVAYYLRMNRSPRKQVPIGPDHQANIPVWDRHIEEQKLDQSGTSLPSPIVVDNAEEAKLMGKCILPIPESKIPGIKGRKAGHRRDCVCLDRGSIRCVRQHIMEAREELIETMGFGKFVMLGLCEMGEQVSRNWSEEEEDLFQEIVYSNPVSLGQNFWKLLKMAFPSRTTREFVGYYFNVFILRRRAFQNRSKSLDIDSDDDDWHENYADACGVQGPEEDEDSAVESPSPQDIEADHERQRGCIVTDEDGEEENDDDDDRDDGDGCDVGDGNIDVTEEDASEVYSFDSAIQRVDKNSGSNEDDSCTSFEFHSNMEEKTGIGGILGNKLDCNEHYDLGDQLNLFEECGTRFPMASSKDADLLPTCNIIEEIFGQFP